MAIMLYTIKLPLSLQKYHVAYREGKTKVIWMAKERKCWHKQGKAATTETTTKQKANEKNMFNVERSLRIFFSRMERGQHTTTKETESNHRLWLHTKQFILETVCQWIWSSCSRTFVSEVVYVFRECVCMPRNRICNSSFLFLDFYLVLLHINSFLAWNIGWWIARRQYNDDYVLRNVWILRWKYRFSTLAIVVTTRFNSIAIMWQKAMEQSKERMKEKKQHTKLHTNFTFYSYRFAL